MSELEEILQSISEGEGSEKNELSFAEILVKVKEIWSYLWSKKIIIIICGFLFAAIGLIYICNKKINYTADYLFTIEGESSYGGYSLSSLLGMGGSGVGAFSGDNLVALMQSSAMIERTLLNKVPNRNMNFVEYAILVDSLREKSCGENAPEKTEDVVSICDVHFPLDLERNSYSREQDSILKLISKGIAENIVVGRVDKKLSFVTFAYTHTDEQFAKDFADAYMREVIDFYVTTKTSRTQKNLEMFQQQADSLKREYTRAMYSRAAYSDVNLNATRQIVNVENQRKQADIQIMMTAYSEIVKNIEVLKLDLAKESPLIQIIQEPRFPLSNDKSRKLKGIIIGGLLGGFLSCGVLLGIYFLKNLLKQSSEIAVREK